MQRSIQRVVLPAGLLVAGAGLSLLLAGPSTAATTASPLPTAPSSAAPTPVPSGPLLSAAPTAAPSAPGAIQVPAGNAGVRADHSAGAWPDVALLGGGALLVGAGGLAVARRR
ncbi:MAG: hypothetical protein ACR2N4_07335 [Jatrophihabitans sp.]